MKKTQEHALRKEKINNYIHTLKSFKGLIIVINKYSYKQALCIYNRDNMEIL